jgi:DeoR/GlpR family transcriptional regulator of sugar metabolism
LPELGEEQSFGINGGHSLGSRGPDNMHAQICVMGAVGIGVRAGLTKHDVEAFPIKKRMIDISHQLI